MKIGVFGGAFNPVHNGHLQLMNSYLNALCLDKIILIPTAVPPHKTDAFLAPAKDRLNMLRLIAKQNERLEVSDIEFKQDGKSYTYYTLSALRASFPDDEFFLIIGSDQYLYFQNWFRADDIVRLATVCTMARNQGEYETLLTYRAEHSNMADSIVSDFDVVVVSSTEIREYIKNGKSIEGLVPKEVEEYIKEHKLYV